MHQILIVNGPNLNMLGIREPGIYGKESLAGIEAALEEKAASLEVSLSFFQSNSESQIIDCIQPVSYTHLLFHMIPHIVKIDMMVFLTLRRF